MENEPNTDCKEVSILFDSGAGTSVMSAELFPELKTSNGTEIHGIGGAQISGKPVRCNIYISSTWETVHELKPMTIPGNNSLVILGRDFLRKFGNTEFDWKNSRVKIGEDWIFMVSEDHQQDVENLIDKCKIGQELSPDNVATIKNMLKDFCKVFVKNSKAPKLCTTEVHRIFTEEESRICKDKVRRLPMKWKGEIDKQIDEMLQNDIISPSCSSYNSNPLLIEKKDNTFRFVIDYRNLNKSTIPDSYPLPDVNEMIDSCRDAKLFTQIDLASGYWCLAVHEDDRHKTSFSVPNGKYEFKRMPFGLKNSQATFQRAIDKVINNVHKAVYFCVQAYVDNIIIFSETLEDHLLTLQAVLSELMQHNLSLRPDKCEFAQREIDFLGYHIGKGTIKPSEANIKELADFPTPKTKKQIERLLGIANFNRRFIPGYAELTKPLTSLLSDKITFAWGEQQQISFNKIKTILSAEPALGLPDWNKEFFIQTDASNISVGGMLFQMDEKKQIVVLAYHSKTIAKSQKSWSATEYDMYGILVCYRKWRDYCNGIVTFITDHEPLKYIRNHRGSRGKIIRWLLELESIDYEIKHIAGKLNHVADALSRVEIEDVPTDITDVKEAEEQIYINKENTSIPVSKLEEIQEADPYVRKVMQRLKNGKRIIKGPFRTLKNLNIKNGLLRKGERIVIPEKFQAELINQVHGQHHLGSENTILLLKARFWWRGMNQQVEELVRTCQTCSACKITKAPRAELVLNEDRLEPLRDSISIDIASMPKSLRGNNGFLLIIDLATKFVSVALLSSARAEFLHRGLWDKWFSIFGIPSTLRSDQGQNVDGNVIKELCGNLEIKKTRSSPYHPEGNGAAERAIGSIKTLMSLMCESRKIIIED